MHLQETTIRENQELRAALRAEQLKVSQLDERIDELKKGLYDLTSESITGCASADSHPGVEMSSSLALSVRDENETTRPKCSRV